MIRTPESFELTQEDIERAITYWINMTGSNAQSRSFKIDFKTETKLIDPVPGARRDGKSDWATTVVTAVAQAEE